MSAPHTEESLTAGLRALGVHPGDVLLVQASLRGVGRIDGGPAAMVRALRAALGPAGTLVGYTATPENSDTSRLDRDRTAALAPDGLAAYREAMPAFDPLRTPASPTMGRLSEEIRTTPGALRSAHPQTSFAALGPAAPALVAGHALESHLGEESPLARLYEMGARALMIGVPFWRCTALHLADYRAPGPPRRTYGCAVADADGSRRWVTFEDVDLDDTHFPLFADALRRETGLVPGRLGAAECWLMPIPRCVDTVGKWLASRGV